MSTWRTSSYSDSSGNNCVEVAKPDAAVLVRDTADAGGTLLAVDAAAWQRFTAALR